MRSSLPPLSVLKGAAQAAWPERKLTKFRLHQEGWGNLVLEADDRLIFRFPRRRRAAASVSFEVRAIEILSRYLSAPIPFPVRVSRLPRPHGWPFMAYEKVPGKPLSEVRPIDSTGKRRLAGFVGILLSELADLPTRPLHRIGAKPGAARTWENEYRELHERFARVVQHRARPAVRAAVSDEFDRFYSAIRSARYREVATHRDLTLDHILWDASKNRPSGVIDWGDVRLGDPAFDLTALASLGSASLASWTRARRSEADSTFKDRLAFYRRVWPLHGVLYAAETQDLALLRASLARLGSSFSR
jgi:aminoglycoside 2''-phosphotransferase